MVSLLMLPSSGDAVSVLQIDELLTVEASLLLPLMGATCIRSLDALKYPFGIVFDVNVQQVASGTMRPRTLFKRRVQRCT